jgi:DNA-binding NtrC family response regulator
MKTILVLSTDSAVSEAFRDANCLKANIEVITDPNDIFKSIEQLKPDLLIIDFILQEGNGGSVCHQVKCSSQTRNLPVIILSDYPGLFGFVRKFGCNASITKPLDLKALASIIDEVLDEKTEQNEHQLRHRQYSNKKSSAAAHH